MTIDTSQIDKKLREARFFHSKLRKHEQMAFGDHEEFDFYLSAFLSACRTVDWRLRHEQGNRYQAFRKSWCERLAAADIQLLKFMVDDRNLEVHQTGSRRQEDEVRIPVRGSYRDESGTVTVAAPPKLSARAAWIAKPKYYFVVGDRREQVTAVCGRYVELIERLVIEFTETVG